MNMVMIYLFSGFFLALAAGFFLNHIRSDQKSYTIERKAQLLILSEMLTIILATSLYFLLASLWFPGSLFPWLLLINLGFGGYLLFNWEKGRCWRQHRALFYCFLLLPALYYTALSLFTPELLAITGMIYAYLLTEFQFAAFSIRQRWWD